MFCKDPFELEEGVHILHATILSWVDCLVLLLRSILLLLLPASLFLPSSGPPYLLTRLHKMRSTTSSSLLAVIFNLIASGSSQFPPTPKGLTKLESKLNAGIYISYKEVRSFNSR